MLFASLPKMMWMSKISVMTAIMCYCQNTLKLNLGDTLKNYELGWRSKIGNFVITLIWDVKPCCMVETTQLGATSHTTAVFITTSMQT
jgi:hypothetical protein